MSGRGGQVVQEAVEMPGIGRFATLQDPQGATFVAIQPSQPASES